MQVKNKVFAGRWRHTKKEQKPHIKKMFACENFPTPLPPSRQKKIMVRSLKAKVSNWRYDHFRIQKLEDS